MATGHLLYGLLPISSVRLGRLVLDSERPHYDFIDPLPDRPTDLDSAQKVCKDFKETRRFSQSSTLKASLRDLLSLSYEKHDASIATLSAPLLTTHELINSGVWFSQACSQPETRKFLERANDDGRKIYLVVGLRTIQDATIVKGSMSKGNKAVEGDFPTHILTASMLPTAIMGQTGNPGASVFRDTGNGQGLEFNAPGEQILAVIYRKVRITWFSSRTTDNLKLETGNRWKTFWDWRGGPMDADEEEDDALIEANLEASDLDHADDSDSDGDSGNESPYTNTEGSARMKNLTVIVDQEAGHGSRAGRLVVKIDPQAHPEFFELSSGVNGELGLGDGTVETYIAKGPYHGSPIVPLEKNAHKEINLSESPQWPLINGQETDKVLGKRKIDVMECADGDDSVDDRLVKKARDFR